MILLLGAVAAYLVVSGGLGGGGGEAQPTPEGIPSDLVLVAIAAQDIGRGSLIPPDGVIMSRMPANMVVETMISGPDEEGIKSRVVGMIARLDIGRGVPITEEMVTSETGDLLASGSDASLAIPAGYTAIAIPMSRLSGVAYALRDGDQIDVLFSLLMIDVDTDFQSVLPNMATILSASGGTEEFPAPSITGSVGAVEDEEGKSMTLVGKVEIDEELGQPFHLVPQESQRPRVVTQRIVENAQVLHVGTFSLVDTVTAAVVPAPEEGVGAPTGQPAPGDISGPEPPDIITLIVTPQDALVLNWALKVGADITLTLRAPNDAEITETTSVTLDYLVEFYDVTIPPKLPYTLEPRLSELIDPQLSNDGSKAPPSQ
jgi:pilus assembly protein CpaB